jgi:hypothetical protein
MLSVVMLNDVPAPAASQYPPTYTVPEVATMLGVSRQAIWCAVRRGSLECFTLGGSRMRPRVVMLVRAGAVERTEHCASVKRRYVGFRVCAAATS